MDMEEESAPASGQYSAGFIVLDSQTESQEGDIMQYLPALNQNNGQQQQERQSGALRSSLVPAELSSQEGAEKDTVKGNVLATDSEYDQPSKRRVEVNTSSDDVVSESEGPGDITVIQRAAPVSGTKPDESNTENLKKKREDDDLQKQKTDEDDPGSSFHSSGRVNLGSYNQAELSQGHFRGNRCSLQQALSQKDMFDDDGGEEDEDLSSTPSDHIGCLQLSNKPMLVPETIDESSPTELPPSPGAYASACRIIPSSPTDGSYQETIDPNDASMKSTESPRMDLDSTTNDIDVSINTTSVPHESLQEKGADQMKGAEHEKGEEHEEEEYDPYATPTLADDATPPSKRRKLTSDTHTGVEQGRSSQKNNTGDQNSGNVAAGCDGGKMVGDKGREDVGVVYDPEGTSTLADGEPVPVRLTKVVSPDLREELGSESSVIKIEDNESMEVISIHSTQERDLTQSQRYSLHLSPSQSEVSEARSRSGQQWESEDQTQGQSWHSQGRQAQVENQGSVTPSIGQGQLGSQERRSQRISQNQRSQGSSQGQRVKSQGSQGGKGQSSQEMKSQEQDQGSQFIQSVVPSKTWHRGDSQEPGPSHAHTPLGHGSETLHSEETKEPVIEMLDLAFSLERPSVDTDSRIGMSEDSRTDVFRRTKDMAQIAGGLKGTILKEESDYEDSEMRFHVRQGEPSHMSNTAHESQDIPQRESTLQQRSLNTYSAYKAKRQRAKKSAESQLTQEVPPLQGVENQLVRDSDPYAFHATQSQGRSESHPVIPVNMPDPVFSHPAVNVQDTPVSSKKKRHVGRRRVTTRTRQNPASHVTFSEPISTAPPAVMETGAVFRPSVPGPMTSPSTSSSSDLNVHFVNMTPHRTMPVPPFPGTPGVVRAPFMSPPPTASPGVRAPLMTPTTSTAPGVDLSWVFTPSLNTGELCRLANMSDLKQKTAIISQMSSHSSVDIVTKVTITGTIVKHFTMKETYNHGVLKRCNCEEEEDLGEMKTSYKTEVIPPDGYISPSRSTSTVTTGDLGDISSFSSGSLKSNVERSGSSLETSASVTQSIPISTEQEGTVATAFPMSHDQSVAMTTGVVATAGGHPGVITINPITVSTLHFSKPGEQANHICSTPQDQQHLGTPHKDFSSKQSLPSSVETDHSLQEASTINRSGSRLLDSMEMHHSSDLFIGSSDVSPGETGHKKGRNKAKADDGSKNGKGKKSKQHIDTLPEENEDSKEDDQPGEERIGMVTSLEGQHVQRSKSRTGQPPLTDRGGVKASTSKEGEEIIIVTSGAEEEAALSVSSKGGEGGASTSKGKRSSTSSGERLRKRYPADKKLEIVAYAEIHGNCAAGRKYSMSEKNVRMWRKCKEKLQGKPGTVTVKKREPKPRYPQLETILLSWVNQEREEGRSLSLVDVQEKAAKIGEMLGMRGFVASLAWVAKFKKHNNLYFKTRGKDVGSDTRRAFTAAEKLQMISYAEKYGNSAAGRKFLTSEKNLRYWRKSKEVIENLPEFKKRQPASTTLSKHPELETLLLSWVNEEQRAGRVVKVANIRQEAFRLGKVLGLQGFTASVSWVLRFMKRTNVSCHRRNFKQRLKTTKLDKLKIIEYAEKHGKMAAVRHFSASEKSVRDWLRNKEEIRKCVTEIVYPEVEGKISEVKTDLLAWLDEVRSGDGEITIDEVRLQARRLGTLMGMADVRISDDWISQHLMQASSKIRRASYKIDRKLEIIDFAEKHGNRSAGRHYSMSEGNVRMWRKKKERLQKLPTGRRRDERAPTQRRPRKPKHPELETLLLSYVSQETEAGNYVSNHLIQQEATRLAKMLDIKDFQALNPWIKRFRLQNNLPDEPRFSQREVRNAFTAAEKLHMVSYAEKHGNRPASRQFSVSETNIRNWRKNKHVLQTLPSVARKKTFGSVNPKYPELETLLASWVNQEHQAGKVVRICDVKQEGKRLQELLGLKNFGASIKWATKFVKRCNVPCYIRRTKEKKVFTRAEKIEMIEYAERYGKMAAVREFNSSEKSVRDFLRNKDTIRNPPIMESAKQEMEGKISEVKTALLAWLDEVRSGDGEITIDEVRLQARRIGTLMGMADVRISDDWISQHLMQASLKTESPEVPYQDLKTKEASGEETGTGLIQSKPEVGARVIAKWKDKFYYPGVISRINKSRFQVKFDDGDILMIKPQDLLLIERLPIGQPVMVPTGAEAFYEGGLIVGHIRKGGTTQYTVEQDGGKQGHFRCSQVILNEDQAESLIKDTNCVPKGALPAVMEEKIADVTLDNLVEGKRRTGNKYESELDKASTDPQSAQGRKRKYRVDVSPSATSTPTPSRGRRQRGSPSGKAESTKPARGRDGLKGSHKGQTEDSEGEEEIDTDTKPARSTTRDASSADILFSRVVNSPVAPTSRRSHKKSRVELPDVTSSSTKEELFFVGKSFLLTYVEKSTADKEAERDFLRDSSLSDESATECTSQEESIPFDKGRLKTEIENRGGVFISSFDEELVKASQECYLISNMYQRTVKYFQCLAAGIPCVSHLWILNSVSQGRLLDYRSYILQAGISVEKKKVMEWNSRRGALSGLCVLVSSPNSQFRHQWGSILRIAGCDVVSQLPGPNSDKQVHVVVADKDSTKNSLQTFQLQGIPIVGTEWLIQCLINGQRMKYDGHPRYRHDSPS